MKRQFFLMILFFVASFGLSSQQRYNIQEFGAVADGQTLNTLAIQKAIDTATKNGGGQVLIPKGNFLSGSIELKSNIELHLLEGATLLGSTNPDDYKVLNGWKALIIAEAQNNLAITGKGTIDGQGRKLALTIDSLFYKGNIDSADYNFVEMRPKYYLRPQLIEMVQCNNVEIRNIHLKNSSCWVQTYDRCRNLVVDKIRVESDAYWNNDGIDIIDCKNVILSNSFFDTADDGICLKSHSADHLCDSIYIYNCTVRSSASAVKFGSVSRGGFKNIEIRNIKVYDTFRSAIAIECVDGAILEDILVDGITATNTGNAIFIRLGNRWGKDRIGKLRNVILRNIKVQVAFERPDYKYEIRGPELPFFHNTFPSSITGMPGYNIEDVRLENIEIEYPGRANKGLAYSPLSRLDEIPEKESDYPEFSMFGELPAWGFYIRHMDGLQMKNVKLRIAKADYRPAIVIDDGHNIEIEDLSISGDAKLDKIILHKSKNVKIDSTTRSNIME